MTDKRNRAALFRDRLAQAMAAGGQSQSALARAIGVDRSTLSALLAPGTRLPNAQVVAEAAAALGVSSDWLLGLAAAPAPVDQALAHAVELTEAPRALFDAAIYGWHREAAGYKIRHVPASLPDMLKTRAVVEWEYRDALGGTAEAAIAGFEAQLDHLRGARSDYEIALPLHELAAFAAGTGYWAGLPLADRTAQLDRLIRLADELYPGLRLYLFDAHQVFSAPVTVFGPHLAVIYLGQSYVSFRDPARVAAISAHFDWLVRAAPLGARDVGGHLRALRAGL
ncbi:helix-turn-helix domain-containing protein [Tabrizicola oligotrophica]|uniref:Helix-turn-helix domain-containing protein n=1 Tax=Tabrizicola oligotrophica TaxID=2710650 RepID=A0A6M0QYI6_9RHOB|nr:helix-turn-helix domain-containing protein [Tabrizicola oligotrophica]NEY91893.1 helix-turn-helix domain-containing protein [Tabrizicola oligotrophica]